MDVSGDSLGPQQALCRQSISERYKETSFARGGLELRVARRGVLSKSKGALKCLN